MNYKFYADGRAGVDYVSGKSAKGRDPRHPRRVLGDPDEVKRFILASRSKKTGTSGSINYETLVSEEVARRDLDAFLPVVFPGMIPNDDYKVVAYIHDEYPKDPKTKKPILTEPPRTSVHFVFAPQHIPSGKILNPYFVGADRRRLTAWQELTNDLYGYASPKDPERRRAVSLDVNRLPEKAQALKEQVNKSVISAIKDAEITCRADLLAWFRGHGFTIERETKSGLSVSHPKYDRNFKFKGEIYDKAADQQYGISRIIEAGNSLQNPQRRCREIKPDFWRRELEEGLRRKRRELEIRYPDRSSTNPGSLVGRGKTITGGLAERSPNGTGATDRRVPKSPLGHEQSPHLGIGSSHNCGPAERGTESAHGLDVAASSKKSIGRATRRADGTANGLGQPKRGPRNTTEGFGRSGAEAYPAGGHACENHDLPWYGRGGDMGGGPRQHTSSGMERPLRNSSENPELSHANTTPESQSNGGRSPGFLTELHDRARTTADSLRRAFEAARAAIERRFIVGRDSRQRLATAAQPTLRATSGIGRSIGLVGALIERIIKSGIGISSAVSGHGRELRQRSEGFQCHEGSIPQISIGDRAVAASVEALGRHPLSRNHEGIQGKGREGHSLSR